jgi:hypothetical protein
MQPSQMSNPAAITILVLVEALLLLLCYAAASFWGLLGDPWNYFRFEYGWLQAILVIFCIQAGLYLHELYTDLRSFSRGRFVEQLLTVMGVSFLLQALVGYARLDYLQLPQRTMIAGSALVVLVLTAWRSVFFSLIRNSLPSKRLLLLGPSKYLDEIATTLAAEPHLGYTVTRRLADLAAYEAEGFRSDIDQIIVSQSDQHQPLNLPVQALLDAELYGVDIQSEYTFFQTLFARVPVHSLIDAEHALQALPRPQDWALSLQAVYSFLIALALSPLALPGGLILALLRKREGAGAVLERHTLIGRNGVPFVAHTFAAPPGHWLYNKHLDQLPLLWNVLCGSMSLVGPRPHTVAEDAEYARTLPFYQARSFVRPGLFGWAQLNHATERGPLTELEFDLYYNLHLSPAFDAHIVLRSLSGTQRTLPQTSLA